MKRTSRRPRRASRQPKRASRRARPNTALDTQKQLEAVARFVRGLGTWMDSQVEDDYVLIDTREHGSVGNEQPGEADITEAKRVAAALRKEFPEANVEAEVVDEWVSIHVDFKAKRYKSEELAEALKKAFPDAGAVERLGGTVEVAAARVPRVGYVRLFSAVGFTGVDVWDVHAHPSVFGRFGDTTVVNLAPTTIRKAVLGAKVRVR